MKLVPATRVVAFVGCALASAACSAKDISLGDGRSGVAPRDGGGSGVSFGPPALVQGLDATDGDKATDDDPSLTDDLREMFFDSKRSGGSGKEDIWQTARTSTDSPWDAPRFVASVSSPLRDTGIALTGDGLTLYFSSDREDDSDGLDVFVSTRTSRDGEWSEPKHVPEVESSGDDLVSAIDPSGERLYLARRDSADDDYDLYVSVRAGDVFEPPVPIAELNTDDEESDAFGARGGLALIFTRDEDLMLAERASTSEPFGEPVPLDALNSNKDDRDAWATPDLGFIVFSSDRSGEYRIYEARR